jgi:cell division protein FtsQ
MSWRTTDSCFTAACRTWLCRVGRRELVVGLAAIVFAAGVAAQRRVWPLVCFHPYFAIENLNVEGGGALLSQRELLDWAQVRVGASLWDIDPLVVERRLEAHPMIGFAAARRIFPRTFEIVVRERRPRAVLVLDDLFYVDRGGETFGPLAAHHSRDYPVITGAGSAEPGGYRKWALRRALHLLRRCRQRGCPVSVSEIHLDPTRGVVLYPRGPRVQLVLGWEGWEGRIARASRVLGAWEGATDRLHVLDARFRDQVVVELRAPLPPSAEIVQGKRVQI